MPGGAAPGSPLAPTLTPTRCTGAGERGVGATISRPFRGQAGNRNEKAGRWSPKARRVAIAPRFSKEVKHQDFLPIEKNWQIPPLGLVP